MYTNLYKIKQFKNYGDYKKQVFFRQRLPTNFGLLSKGIVEEFCCRSELHRKPFDEVGSLSPAKHPVEFERRTFQFD